MCYKFFFHQGGKLPLNDLFLFCWSTLGALATESKDLFCDCKDALDLILDYCGGGRELCFLGGDEEGGGGGGVFSFVGADEDGGQEGREGEFYLLGGDGKELGKVV